MAALLDEKREQFHQHLLSEILVVDSHDVPANADRGSVLSIKIAKAIIDSLGGAKIGTRLEAQTAGKKFESITHTFLEDTFPRFVHLRPGSWSIALVSRKGTEEIAKFEQYQHLSHIEEALSHDPALAAAIGSDYVIAPDIVISRAPTTTAEINRSIPLISDSTGRHAFIREGRRPVLHASVSCKWTIRSDRSQNARSEGLNLTRNRKGRPPHIVVVTAEPLPARIRSIAIGTGDIDCVYHFALPELEKAVIDVNDRASIDSVRMLVDGNRLKDITDLPLDLLL